MNKKDAVRVVMVTYGFPRLSETFLVRKFLGLLSRGIDVRVVCFRSEGEDWQRFGSFPALTRSRKRITVAPVGSRTSVILRFPARTITCVLRAPRETFRYLRFARVHLRGEVLRNLYIDAPIVSLRPDVIHFEFGSLAVGRTHLREVLRCKLVVSFRGHDIEFVGLDSPNYYSEVWRSSDAVHVLGKFLFERAVARGLPRGSRVVLIPPAVQHGSRTIVHRPPSDGSESILLSVARLNWAKGHEYLLQALRLLIDDGHRVRLRIVGGGSFAEAVGFARRDLRLEEHVEMLGPLSPVDVQKQMDIADIFVHSAVEEGFCNAVLEAQASGLPVVTTDAGGLPENVENGVSGLVVPRRDPEGLASAIATLLQNPRLRNRLGEAGRLRVDTHFRLESQIDTFEYLYRDLLKKT